MTAITITQEAKFGVTTELAQNSSKVCDIAKKPGVIITVEDNEIHS